jgi:hypothetical protein
MPNLLTYYSTVSNTTVKSFRVSALGLRGKIEARETHAYLIKLITMVVLKNCQIKY